ncbi:MAG: hypothetical protein IT458_16390 [Planctomycetes bacterium]|nr:hypothetical protein [Planctomycetota bacterium]
MRTSILGLALLTGCATHHFPAATTNDVHLVQPDGRVEFAVDESGRVLEVEFHCRAEDVPEAVRAAFGKMFPGARAGDCEKEYNGGKLFYEMSLNQDGRDHEVMFTPEGKVHSHEVEVDPARLPAAVVQAAAKAVPNGRQTKTEEIRDGDGKLLEYHVKLERDGRKYKVAVATDGKVLKTVRETPAEIEVPVRL